MRSTDPPVCLSVRGGGGSLIGRSVKAGGVHISMGGFDAVGFDRLSGLVTVGGGASWGDVLARLKLYGRTMPTAECPQLGVGGFLQAVSVPLPMLWPVPEFALGSAGLPPSSFPPHPSRSYFRAHSHTL